MSFQPHFTSLEEHHRPMLLKDFLNDDDFHSCTPSPWSTVAVASKSNKSHIVLLRSWSKRAAATKISAVHKVIKLLQFASMKSPSVLLPKSISRKLTKRSNGDNGIFGDVPEVKVKVKDILRWRSFRDLAEEYPTPLDFPLSPYLSTASAATATATTTTTTSCSKRSSWCDSDFTAEELPPWGGENEEFWGKNAVTLKKPKGDWSTFEEYEQQSPVSVLESPFRKVQKAKCGLTRRTPERSFDLETAISEEVNAVEEKAMQLLSHVKEHGTDTDDDDDGVIFDFFIHELSINGELNDDAFDFEILRVAKSWMYGEFEDSYEWEMEEKRESFVKEMEKEICWNKFREEQKELCEELEARFLSDLMDDFVDDFLARAQDNKSEICG